MQTENLKYNLIDKLISVTDIAILQKISDLIGNIETETSPIILSEKQNEMLRQSEDDILNGRTISDVQLNAEEDEWLNA
ncbi:MAG: hypothetical protein ACOVMQ_12295 [Cyclobacteriaceae bacterium]|jgi:hypothetical protein